MSLFMYVRTYLCMPSFFSTFQLLRTNSEEWSHVLTWDLFVGRWIWLDGIERKIFTPHSVLLTNLIGPPGLVLHFITCFLSGKGLPIQNSPPNE